ncbi:MAG TPA: ATP-binding protein, partial [Dehalococcoidia bacterium]|nr:ATP-binding protein [Dehalococcoidia bacterium]
PWGLLGVFSQARRPFSESDAKFLIAVADTLSCALDRERRLSHLAGTASSLRETLAQREEFMETLSHELRTPASIIHALANVPLRRGLDVPPEERQAVLQDLFDASRRLTETLVVTSEGYRLQPGESIVTEPVNPAAAVASAVRLFKRVQDGHRVRVRAPKQPPLVAASMAQLEEVLLNLLSNAAKHTPQGTPIEIQVEPAGNEVLIRVIDSRFEPAGNEVLIRVIDSGPGIPEADLARVFDPHYRGRATAPGLGLGLTLCKRIIDSFGGKIWLENRPEGGLMATVSLSVVAAGTS